ncbi:MAG: hypothetical protein HQL20_07715 [Candidatus Omnitrophica bacterium]|nr:hypothetical protein [Candidatus Omnitrophota bacterium]
MTGGITPLDNAFELLGLHHCSALLKFIFIDTLAGKVIFGLGFILALARSLAKTNFRPVIVFCAMFFSVLFLLVLPRIQVQVPLAAMEEAGSVTITTYDILRKAGSEQVSASPVLVFLGRSISAFVNGAINVIDLARAHKAGFLKEPFITAKLALVARDRICAGIKDPVIKGRVVDFYHNNYFRAVRVLKDRDGSGYTDLWPGSAAVGALYSAQGVSEWRVLKEDIYRSLNKGGVFDRLASDYYNGSSLTDPVVRAVLEADINIAPWTYSSLSLNWQWENLVPDNKWANIKAEVVASWISRAWLLGFPFIYGIGLWSVWAALPLVLIFMFFSVDIGLAGLFLKILLMVKVLPLFWAFTDRASVLAFDIVTFLSHGKVFLWDMWGVGLVASLGMGGFGLVFFIKKGKT